MRFVINLSTNENKVMASKKNNDYKPKFATREPTLIDVAKVAGVSPITVSRALNQPEKVSEHAREKVKAAVAKTGYVPNLQAGSLASRSSRLIAIIVPTIAHSIFSSTVQAITDTLSEKGYQTLLGLSGYDAEQEQKLIETILGRRPDGIVLTGTLHTAESRKRLQAANIPVVETWDLTTSPIDSVVGFSHHRVGVSVGEYLWRKGYRKIAVISADDKRAHKRKKGLMSVLTRQGLNAVPTKTVSAPTSLKVARDAIAELLDRGEAINAVYCSSDTLAQGVISELQSRKIRIPEDIAVIGFGDLEFAAYSYPSITSVKINGYKIGQRSANILLDKLKKPGDNREVMNREDVGFAIVVRDSA